MSSNVGLSTPRGSGTSGYVQRNAALLKPRSTGVGQPYSKDTAPRQRKPDANILAHDRMREIEVQVLELRDRLEEEAEKAEEEGKGDGMDEEAIEEACEKERERLVKEMESGRGKGGGSGGRLKSYQVHELAEAKARESERLRRALGLRGDEVGGKDGDEHPMARQERRRVEKEQRELEGGGSFRRDDR
jgi:hypothetical protein